MVANKIGCLAIHEEGNRDNVNGIFSERDFLNKVFRILTHVAS